LVLEAVLAVMDLIRYSIPLLPLAAAVVDLKLEDQVVEGIQVLVLVD
jgi:hypothetical protein